MGMTERFTHKGESWMRISADPVDRFCIGVHLGQSSDPTAIATLAAGGRPAVCKGGVDIRT